MLIITCKKFPNLNTCNMKGLGRFDGADVFPKPSHNEIFPSPLLRQSFIEVYMELMARRCARAL